MPIPSPLFPESRSRAASAQHDHRLHDVTEQADVGHAANESTAARASASSCWREGENAVRPAGGNRVLSNTGWTILYEILLRSSMNGPSGRGAG